MTTSDGSRSAGAMKTGAFYDTELRTKLEPEENDKFIVIDAKSLDYEVDPNLVVATVHLRDRQPDGEMFAFRIGSKDTDPLRSGQIRIKE